jgi:hypothetical protein
MRRQLGTTGTNEVGRCCMTATCEQLETSMSRTGSNGCGMALWIYGSDGRKHAPSQS